MAASTSAGNDLCQTSCHRAMAASAELPRRDGMIPAIIVEAAPRLLAEPAGFDILHQQRAGPVLRIREALVEHLHDRETGIEPDEVGQLQRSHRVIGAE